VEGQPEKLPNARQRSQAQTRARLLEAAARLFAKNGCINTTTKDLAQEAGVAVGTVYLHFQDKDALLDAVLKLALTYLRQEMARQEPGHATGNALVEGKMAGLVGFTESYTDLAAVLFDPGNLATLPGREALDFLTKSQESGLRAGITARYYRGDLHSGLAARAMVGILVQVLGWWARNQDAADRDEVIEVLTEMRLRGLGVKG
jgi:AcrR family transcriptional regulator